MAGNSVPFFFGAKARLKKPPGLDVTSITDISGSMGPYANFITAPSTFIALENALLSQEIGLLSPNRYSFTVGGGPAPSFSTLVAIERNVVINGISQRWAPGANILNGTATLPSYTVAGGDNEDMGLASNLITNNNRFYLPGNELIIIAGSDEQSYGTTFTALPSYPHRYIGIHTVSLAITEPAGPNSVPAGTLVGFVYTTNITGTAIYLDGSTLNYRSAVPVGSVTAIGAPGVTLQLNVDHAATTNGAIYKIDAFSANFDLLATSLGTVLGQYLYEIS